MTITFIERSKHIVLLYEKEKGSLFSLKTSLLFENIQQV